MKNPKRRRRLSDRERDILASIKEAERKERLALNRHLSAICAAVEKPLTKKQLRSAERVRLSRVMSTVTFLPQAWIGYTMPKRGASRARVKICRRCPDRGAAVAEAKDLDVQWVVCPKCARAGIASVTAETP